MSLAPRAISETVFGPFLDETFFHYHDGTNYPIKGLKVYQDDTKRYIGLDDLEVIHDRGRKGTFENVFFSGNIKLTKTKSLCEAGFLKLLSQVRVKVATATPDKLRKWCKEGSIIIELLCQLKQMPTCYIVGSWSSSVLIISDVKTNIHAQRRYLVESFHFHCFRRSEYVFRRHMMLKFIIDAVNRNRKIVPRNERDVHWLVDEYMKDYLAIFPNRQKPTLHRSEVYDYFFTYRKWLGNFWKKNKWDMLHKDRWEDWVAEAEENLKASKRKGKQRHLAWGTFIRRKSNLVRPEEAPEEPEPVPSEEYFDGDPNYFNIGDYLGIETASSEESSEYDSSEDGEEYTMDENLIRPLVHAGLLRPMSEPQWFWTCDITGKCNFSIDLLRCQHEDLPFMACLSDEEKAFLRSSMGDRRDVLHSGRLGRIWKKVCQTHMDWHWREAGIAVDHTLKIIRPLEEEYPL